MPTSLFHRSPWVKVRGRLAIGRLPLLTMNVLPQSTLVPSRHRETVSVIMLVGDNDHNILDVTHSVLDMTVGPYELIGACASPTTQMPLN